MATTNEGVEIVATIVEAAARAAHEANRAYCAALGDESQVPWDDAPRWQRDSALEGVRFLVENPGAPASAQHSAWLEQKRRDGWKFGPKKDAGKREHPCIVPYEELPGSQRAKDAIFQAVVRGVLAYYTLEG